MLAGVFAGLVALATDVHPFKTPVAVAASTLAAAALFNPLRRRVQRAVDRRFNRARYNAEAIVAAFTARLHGTVDLDTAQGDLVAVVHQVFEPAHVSVWVPTTGQREARLPRTFPRHVSSRRVEPTRDSASQPRVCLWRTPSKSKPQSTAYIGLRSGASTRKVFSELGRWELLKLPRA